MIPRIFDGRGFAARGDRSIGWPSAFAKQARAMQGALGPAPEGAAAREASVFAFPPSPFPLEGTDPFVRATRALALRAARVLGLSLAWAFALYILCTSLLIACFAVADPPATVLMAYRKYGYGWAIKPPSPRPLSKVPPYIRRMLISVEDGKYYEHFGFDMEAFRNAREINARIGERLYGGSTLTMQVARTLFLVPVKSYIRKGLEVVVALELELLLSKDRILELYFGYAEWGKGLFGMESAARAYYGKGLQALTRDEAARLVALLSSPIKYGPKTLSRNGILRERYAYLTRRYVSPPSAAASVSPNALSGLDALSGIGAAAPAQEAPPPNPEPSAVDAAEDAGAEDASEDAGAEDAAADPPAAEARSVSGNAAPGGAAPAPANGP